MNRDIKPKVCLILLLVSLSSLIVRQFYVLVLPGLTSVNFQAKTNKTWNLRYKCVISERKEKNCVGACFSSLIVGRYCLPVINALRAAVTSRDHRTLAVNECQSLISVRAIPKIQELSQKHPCTSKSYPRNIPGDPRAIPETSPDIQELCQKHPQKSENYPQRSENYPRNIPRDPRAIP